MITYPHTYFSTRNTRRRERLARVRAAVYAVALVAVYLVAITKLFPNW